MSEGTTFLINFSPVGINHNWLALKAAASSISVFLTSFLFLLVFHSPTALFRLTCGKTVQCFPPTSPSPPCHSSTGSKSVCVRFARLKKFDQIFICLKVKFGVFRLDSWSRFFFFAFPPPWFSIEPNGKRGRKTASQFQTITNAPSPARLRRSVFFSFLEAVAPVACPCLTYAAKAYLRGRVVPAPEGWRELLKYYYQLEVTQTIKTLVNHEWGWKYGFLL